MFPNVLPRGDPEGDLLIVVLGLDVWRDHASGEGGARQGPQDRPLAFALSESPARKSGRYPEALQEGAGAGTEHGPTAVGPAREIPGGRRRPQQNSGPSFQTKRTRTEDRRNAGSARRAR